MYKSKIVILGFVLMILPLHLVAQTEDPGKNVNNIFLRLGYMHPIESNFNGGFVSAGGFYLGLGDKIGLELEVLISFISSEQNTDVGYDVVGSGDIVIFGANAKLLYYIKSDGKLRPYLTGGVGYSINDFTVINSYSDYGFTIDESLDGSVVLRFGLGCDFLLSDSISLNLDLSYCINNSDGEWSIIDDYSDYSMSGTTKNDLSAFTLLLGTRFYL